MCPMCDMAPESIEHLFLQCSGAVCAWFTSELNYKVDLQSIDTFDKWFENIICIMENRTASKEEFLTKIVFFLWEIWKARNAFVYDVVPFNSISVARKASLAALEFNTCKHHQVPLVDRQNQTPQSQVSITHVSLTSFSSPPLESTSHPHLEASPDPNHTHIHTSPNHNTPSHNPYPSNPIHPSTSVTHCHNHIPHDQVHSIPSHNYQNQHSQPIHRTNLQLPNHRSSFFTINNKSNLRWSPPPPGHIKINFDAAWINETKLTGIGVLARDCHGSLIDGSSLLCLSGSPLEAEARAALTAVTLANKFHHVPIIFESDSKVLVDCISMNDSAQNWKIAPIISKINHSTTLNGRAVWLWIHREANSVADLVASLVVRKKCPVVWIDRPPSSLVGVLSRDGLPCPPQVQHEGGCH
ncbi:hypothetical protein M0R45_021301 [Rubus argutus]|uniref:RNase H type-1 domain-containing protein n=1 Tax=Rubus argutus TaxID=59490 RepID=A0AAW1XC53_RUBAR